MPDEATEPKLFETEPSLKSDRPLGLYVSPSAPKYYLKLKPLGVMVQFENGSFSTDDPKIVEALDIEIARSNSISQIVRKVDVSEAERFARAQKQKLMALGGAAVKGQMTSTAASLLAQATLDERDMKLKAQGVDPETVDTGDTGEMLLTHAVATEQPGVTKDLTPKSGEEKKAAFQLLTKKTP